MRRFPHRSALALRGLFMPAVLALIPALILALILFQIAACSPDAPSPDAPSADASSEDTASDAADAEASSVRSPADASEATLIVFLGDSLTAGYGLDEEQAFPHLVGETLRAEGRHLEIVNAGSSGDTTAGGLARLDWLLRQGPDILVVGLGGNDGLRGLDLDASESNLRQIVSRAQAAGVEVLLLGMLIPPNYGPEYTEDFAAMYPRLAQELDVAFVPFLLESVAGDPELNLPDGIHPNVEGQKLVAKTVVEGLRALLARGD